MPLACYFYLILATLDIWNIIIKMFLYKNILTLRVINRYTQKYIVSALDLSQPYYSRIEKGEVDIHISLLIKIAELYEISVERLLNSDLEEESKTKLH